MSGWQHGRRLVTSQLQEQIIGLGSTASLVSSRPKQGEHRVYLATQTVQTTRAAQIVFHKQARTRIEEERLVADLILNELAQVCKLDINLQLQLLPGEELKIDICEAPVAWQQLLTGEIRAVHCTQQQSALITEPDHHFGIDLWSL